MDALTMDLVIVTSWCLSISEGLESKKCLCLVYNSVVASSNASGLFYDVDAGVSQILF